MKILVPVDGSNYCSAALQMAKDIAEKYEDSTLFLLNVQRRIVSRPNVNEFEISEFITDDPEVLNETGNIVLNKAKNCIEGTNVKVDACVKLGDPADQIIDTAERARVDMIVMGSLGATGVKRFLMGSVSTKVVNYSSIPVLVVKH
ncbi:universal stress protein [Candidatus Contubernalis alkaliaceticus]|uniref:universal stress protein n=1 Tax=Candidatus Contubernalis alkaliaceticus TaxID=338645 RepID=UPI001F4BDF4C|nr:universal stress protein [Candidatus Contubernalis alkalaceticus]UNC91805.1 universal stress protein [Candidatus Contubernalis alkalaceticus]